MSIRILPICLGTNLADSVRRLADRMANAIASLRLVRVWRCVIKLLQGIGLIVRIPRVASFGLSPGLVHLTLSRLRILEPWNCIKEMLWRLEI